jgi:outer membrane protein TolC
MLTVMACGAFPCKAETLDDAYRSALAGDYRVKSSDESVAAAEESVAAAKAYRYPSLKGAGSYTWLDDTPSTSVRILPILPPLTFPLMKDDKYWMSDLTLSVPVFTGFRITHGVRAAEAVLDAGQAGCLTTVQDVKMKTAESYVAVLRAGHGLEVAKSNVTALTAHARDVGNAYGKGLVPKNDVLAVQVALADARQTEIRVENILALARAAYNRQVGRPLDTPVTLDDLDRPEDSTVLP